MRMKFPRCHSLPVIRMGSPGGAWVAQDAHEDAAFRFVRDFQRAFPSVHYRIWHVHWAAP